MICAECGEYIGEYKGIGKRKQYCPVCLKVRESKQHNRYFRKIREQGLSEVRPEKTDAELEAIKAKYSKPGSMDDAIDYIGAIMANELSKSL